MIGAPASASCVVVACDRAPSWDAIAAALLERGIRVEQVGATAAAVRGAVHELGADAVVIDAGAAAAPAIELARAVRASGAVVPIIAIGDPDAATEALAAEVGITDWLPGPEPIAAQLVQRLRHVVRVVRAEAIAAAALAVAHGATRTRDDVLAFVAHDLRAPLHSIRLACGELASDLPFDVAARFIRAIETAARRGDDLIGELLEIVRIDNDKLELELKAIDIRPLIRRACGDHELIAASSRTHLEVVLPDGPVRVHADPRWIARVLTSLLGNALVHARGSTVSIEVRTDPETVTVTVTDGGRGIAAAELPHVFDRFWQGREHRGGAGLGLAIAKGVIEAHHGHISAANLPDRGACFAFTLPRVAG
jgi:signal transduction histidine kinase